MAEYKNKTREQVAAMFLDALKEGEGLNWKRNWIGIDEPYSVSSGNEYRGINYCMLKLTSVLNQWSDPRWCTFRYASEQGWKVRKGEKGTPIEYWYYYDKIHKRTMSIADYNAIQRNNPELIEKLDFHLCVKNYYVFNAEQIEGIPERTETRLLDFQPEPVAEQFLANLQEEMNISIRNDGSAAAYSPTMDVVFLPKKEHFLDETAYYSVAFHELGHASGHSSRLNRDLSGKYGSPEYAMEELRVEIASCMLDNELHLRFDEEHENNHKAYVVSWIKAIEKNPDVLMKAIKDAEHIADYLEKKGKLELCLEKNPDSLTKEEPVMEQPVMEQPVPEQPEKRQQKKRAAKGKSR